MVSYSSINRNIPLSIFTGENYDNWNIKMKTLFSSEDLWDVVSNGINIPSDISTLSPADQDKLKEDGKKDARALYIIQQALADDIFPKIMKATSAKAAWEILREEFQATKKALRDGILRAGWPTTGPGCSLNGITSVEGERTDRPLGKILRLSYDSMPVGKILRLSYDSEWRPLSNDSQWRPSAAAACSCFFGYLNEMGISNEEFERFPRFGPSYGEDKDVVRSMKEAAWRHIVTKTGRDESTVYGIYEAAIERIASEAMETYDPGFYERMVREAEEIHYPANFASPNFGPNDPVIIERPNFERLVLRGFVRMMIIDGCYFLQLALSILGGAKLLDYPENHVVFGISLSAKMTRQWIKAMYFVGNQIPHVVICELMNQDFFRNILKVGKESKTWRLPPNLPKMVLYLVVVEPELLRLSEPEHEKGAPYFREPPSDLLHGLHCLVLGPGSNFPDSKASDVVVDFENRYARFPCARALEKRGFALRKAAKQGIREIHFKTKFLYFPYLYIPPFTFDCDTKLMFQYLKNYERKHKMREVTAYLCFMSDLIQIEKDINILISKGIIEVAEGVDKKDLLAMLRKLDSKQITWTKIFHRIRSHIN